MYNYGGAFATECGVLGVVLAFLLTNLCLVYCLKLAAMIALNAKVQTNSNQEASDALSKLQTVTLFRPIK